MPHFFADFSVNCALTICFWRLVPHGGWTIQGILGASHREVLWGLLLVRRLQRGHLNELHGEFSEAYFTNQKLQIDSACLTCSLSNVVKLMRNCGSLCLFQLYLMMFFVI